MVVAESGPTYCQRFPEVLLRFLQPTPRLQQQPQVIEDDRHVRVLAAQQLAPHRQTLPVQLLGPVVFAAGLKDRG